MTGDGRRRTEDKLMLTDMGKKARAASKQLARATTDQKNAVLLKLADGLLSESEEILAANEKDISEGKAAGLTPALLDRLTLNVPRLTGIADDLKNVAALRDPVG